MWGDIDKAMAKGKELMSKIPKETMTKISSWVNKNHKT